MVMTRQFAVLALIWLALVAMMVVGLMAPVAGADAKTLPAGSTPDAWSYERDGMKGFPVIDFGSDANGKDVPSPDPIVEKAREKAREQARALYTRYREQANGRNWDEARGIVDRLITEYPRQPLAAQALSDYVNRLARDKTRRHEALAAARKLLKTFPNYSWSAYWAIQRITGRRLGFYNQGRSSVQPGQRPRLRINGRNIDEVEFKVYKVDLEEMAKAGQSLFAPTVPDGARPVASWTVEPASNRRNHWFNRNVEIPVTEPGAYLVTLGSGELQWTTMVFVSRLAMATKCDNRVLLAYASESKGAMVQGPCAITVFQAGKILYHGATNAGGLFAARVKGQAQGAIMLARKGEDVALCNVRAHGSRGGYGQIYTYSDRPVYRPGQTVRFKTILRRFQPDTSEFTFTRGESLDVVIRDPKWNEVVKKKVTVNEFGTAEFSMTLGDEPPLGYYQVRIRGSNAWGSYSFSVEEYKKPEYEVKVEFDRKSAVIGDAVQVRVGARYYFGEKVKGARVTCEVYASPRWNDYPLCCKAGYRGLSWFAEDYLAGYRPRGFAGGRLLYRGEGRLDKDGRFSFNLDTARVEALEKAERKRPHRYPWYGGGSRSYNISVRAVVTDKSRRGITGHSVLTVARSGVQVSLAAERYSYRPGEKVRMNIRATDLSGAPVSVRVSLVIKARQENGDYLERSRKEVNTSDQGQGVLVFKAERSGYYQVEAVTLDQAGRKSITRSYVWVAEQGWRSPYTCSGLQIKTDQDLYQPGDTAQVLITSGYADHPVLYTVEADYIMAWRLDRFAGSLCTFDQPITRGLAPMANLTAMLFANDSFVRARKPIVVPPADKWLSAEIRPDRKQYKPGDEAVYMVELKDHAGRPVRAELSFGLVDEAIYALKPDNTPDIRKFFYGQRRRYIYTQTSFNFTARGVGGQSLRKAKSSAPQQGRNLGGQIVGEASAARDGAVGADLSFAAKTKGVRGGALVQPRVRKDFADSAVWLARVMTGTDGRARIAFRMPDNLTTWRAKLIAITASGLVGVRIHKAITRQNLMVRLECPRTFTQYDKVTVSAVVHNYLATAKNCVVRLTQDGGELLRGAPEQSVKIAPGEDMRVDWLLTVRTHGRIKLKVAALTDEESDAMEKSFPVIPHGLEVVAARGGIADDKQLISIGLPQNADPARQSMRLSLAPSLAANMMDGLEYLAGFPYGCVEQTMSRFLPSVYVQHAVDGLQLQNDELRQKLPQYVQKGLQRLYGFQHGDGGWGWWKHDKSNHYMSAYVIYGLAQARKAGYTVSGDRAMDRGLRYLEQVLSGKVRNKYKRANDQQEESLDTRAYVVYAYANARQPNARWITDLYGKRDQLSDYSLALLLDAMRLAGAGGNKGRAENLAGMLVKRASVTGTSARWGGRVPEHGHWQNNGIQATARALRALTAVDSRNPILGKAVNWLVNQRRGGYWISTKDTAATVAALADYMQVSGEMNPDYEASLMVNGKLVKTFHVAGNALQQKPMTFDFAARDLRPGENRIEIRKHGAGSLYYACTLRSWTKGEGIPAVNQGLRVEREFLLLVPRPDNSGYERRPLQGPVRSGQEIEVRLTVNTSAAQRYFMLEDYFPAGCEVVKDKSDMAGVYGGMYRRWWGYCSNRESRDEKMVFFSSWLGAGKRTFVYTLRAETPGEYGVMPARGSLMYEPDLRGSCAKGRLVVVE